MRLLRNALMVASLAGAVWLAQEQEAAACGGCFVPPEESTQVTGHRMILSVGMTQSTLYDQIEYSGNPAEFAWVLPIAGTVDVGVSSDLIFNQLGVDTAVSVLPPPRTCPPIYCDGYGAPSGEDSLGSGTGGGGANDGGVDVLAEEVVGPYETVQLASSDPQALNQWLLDHGYSIPADIQPVINAYVNDGFNFLAMKLVPGAGIERMAPVRITTQGSNAVLPLRMVAAGTGANTTITLWIVGEGRYEPSNFPAFQIDPKYVVWDYDTNDSNYTDLRAQAYEASEGFGWLTEAARAYSPDAFRSNILNVVDFNPDQSGYSDGSGTDYEAARLAAEEDLDVLFGGMNEASVHVTRVRAELSRAALGTDLIVGATDDQSDVANVIQTTSFEGTQPACPTPPDGCWYYDENDYDNDYNGRDTGGSCTLTQTPSPSSTAAFGLALFGVGLGVSTYRRRRR